MIQHKFWFFLTPILLIFRVSAQNPGDILFQSDRVHTIEISFHQPGWIDSLKYYHEEGNDKYLIGNVKINSNEIKFVGIRITGTGSYYNVIDYTNKVSLKVDLNKYVLGQTFDGLNKLNLNNGYNDPSFMRQKVFSDFMDRQDAISPRCTYANVIINGTDWGFYILTEQVDRTFLSTNFGKNTGNLYEGYHGAGLNWEGYSKLNYEDNFMMQSSQNHRDWSDLINLSYVINNTPSVKFQDSLEQVLSTDYYIRTWAANNLFANLNVYEYSADNYYIYNDPFDNKFYWISSGAEGAFGGGSWDVGTIQKQQLSAYYMPTPPPSPLNDTVPLTGRMLESTYYIEKYKAALCEYLQGDFTTMYLYPKIDDIYNRIEPFVKADNNKLYSDQHFENNINFAVSIDTSKELPGLKSFIADRIFYVSNEIGCAVSTEERSYTDVSVVVSPNPVNTTATLKIEGRVSSRKKQPFILSIYDILGREVLHKEHIKLDDRIIIDGNNFAKGVFFYKLYTFKEEQITGKIIIQ